MDAGGARLTAAGSAAELEAALPTPPDALLWDAGLRALAQGLLVFEPSLAPVRPVAPRVAARGGVDPLTPREREVLLLLAEGASNKDIAARLAISEHTAKFHVSAVLSKLGVQPRTEAVVRAARLGWVTL